MAIYEAQTPLDATTNELVVAAGQLNLTLSFKWPDAMQELYNRYTNMIELKSKADPLVTKDMAQRKTYNWVDFYSSLPSSGLDAWYASAEFVPQSVIRLPEFAAVAELESRRLQAVELKDIMEHIQECLVWQVIVNDGEEQTVLYMRIGGWYIGTDNLWRIRFTSSLTEIGYDSLQYVNIEVEV